MKIHRTQLNVSKFHFARRNPIEVTGSNRYVSGAVNLLPSIDCKDTGKIEYGRQARVFI
jgi:hypothetical protein